MSARVETYGGGERNGFRTTQHWQLVCGDTFIADTSSEHIRDIYEEIAARLNDPHDPHDPHDPLNSADAMLDAEEGGITAEECTEWAGRIQAAHDDEIERLRAIKKSDDGAYENVVELYREADEAAEIAQYRLDESLAREKAWMNGVADAVEHLGFDREAACGPADLLPGLKWLVERTDDCDDDCVHAPMCRKWGPTCATCNDTGHIDDDAGQVPCPACVVWRS